MRDRRRQRRNKNAIMHMAIVLAVLVALLIIGIVSCSAGTRVIFTTGFAKNEVFRIQDMSCTTPEIMVYLTTSQNQYENVYGSEVWTISKDEVSLADNVKETVLAKVAQIKSMCLLAKEREIFLTDAEKAQVNGAALEYYSTLSERERELLGVDAQMILKLYKEYRLAEKVYESIIEDVNPEISDDEARIITVQHILLRTYETDESGSRVPYSPEKKSEIAQKAQDIYLEAASGKSKFADLAAKYSEDAKITYSFGMGEMAEPFETTAFALATNEISKVIETEEGYHIIKCINTFDREQTDLNKIEILEERRRDAFGEQYNRFVKELVYQLNESLWEEISFLHDSALDTMEFFDVYHRYFPKQNEM